MPYKAHRHGDNRACGATTVVEGQSSLYVNNKLWAVDNDPNTHSNGNLKPSGSSLYINNKLVIVHRPDIAKSADQQDHDPVQTQTAEGSGDTFAY
jgi:hypothetical protein